LNVENINKGYDIVIIARNTLKGKKFAETESAFLHLAKLHGIRCL
jgi:ribonuclease P protein component